MDIIIININIFNNMNISNNKCKKITINRYIYTYEANNNFIG